MYMYYFVEITKIIMYMYYFVEITKIMTLIRKTFQLHVTHSLKIVSIGNFKLIRLLTESMHHCNCS